MRTLNKIILFFGIIITAVFSCDKIEEPFIENISECGDANLPIPIRQILIEEFTGHQCGNCPEGAETIEFLKESYCDHIIPVAIHAGYFAEIKTFGNEYKYEYRTEDGNTIDTYFEASSSGVPNGMINRKEINGDRTLTPAKWITEVAKMLLEDPVLRIKMETNYTADSRELEIYIDIEFFESINSNLMLSVYFVEDNIVSWQKDYSLPENEQDIEFYVHNHVLRDAINGAWGEQILNGQASSSDVKSKDYTYNINQDWVIENSSIVAFVYRNDTKEVLQASQIHL